MLHFGIIFYCFTIIAVVNCENTYKIVKTNSGPIRGRKSKENTIWYNKPYYSFNGIPYAEAPVGELRFKAPQPKKPWTEVFDAFEYGCVCSQIFQWPRPASEDCLFLNIHVPAINGSYPTKKLPVFFFIHGGLFVNGAGDDTICGPDFFNEHEIIVVTINYRLGMLGFMSLGINEYSGNMGLKDQQIAMKWIYQNIEAFGGDREKITLSGLSAGAKAVGLHLLNEESSKYFNQIFCMSGSPNAIFSYQTGDHRCLVDVNEITKFTWETIYGLFSPWGPVPEKSNTKNVFFEDDPMASLEKMKSINKSAYYTFTEYEQLSFIEGTDNNYADPRSVDAYLKDFHFNVPIFGYQSTIWKKPAYLKNTFEKVYNLYFKNAITDQEKLRQRLQLDSDIYYIYFLEKWMERHVAISNKNTFYHRFSVVSNLNTHAKFHGASHGDDIRYIIRYKSLSNQYKEIKEKKNSDTNSSIAFKAMNSMQKMVSNFVKFGNPIHNNDPIERFHPIQHLSKLGEFDFVDVTNDGLIPGKAPNAVRIKFIDEIVKEVMRLVHENNETPTKNPIQQQCDAIHDNSSYFNSYGTYCF